MDALLSDGVDVAFDSLGVAGTFTPSGGSGQAVVCIPLLADREGGPFPTGARRVGKSFLVRGISGTPHDGDALVVSGTNYVVRDTQLIAQGHAWQLTVRE